jgi:type VI secretion system protein ImpG
MDSVAVEKAYVAELEALEKFRVLYTGLHPNAPLAREDPDVRRLIEALAFFSARTRVAAERTVNESLLRIFRQHFPYTLSPMPAMVMLRATSTPSHVDTVELPRGVGVLVRRRPTKGQPGGSRRYHFRTTAPLRLVPLSLDAVELGPGKNKGHRIILRLSSRFARTEPIGKISLHVNHLNDLFASMTMLLAFKQHLVRASVVYGKTVYADTEGAECGVSFGAPEPGPDEMAAFEHPEQRFRAALHFPQAEQYLHLDVPGTRGSWQQIAICLDVGEGWPLEYSLTPDTFDLNVVPVMNIKQDMADPIECDGTQERYPVRHPDAGQGMVPHSLLGVYQLTPKGMAPMEPGVLGPTKQGYETVFEGKDEARRAWVMIDLPTAFYRPENVAIEAFWSQPDLTGAHADELEVQLAERHVEGVRWDCSGALVPHATNELEDDRDSLLAMVSLKSLRFLGLDELTFLARALGSMRRPEFARITLALEDVRLEARPAGRKAGGVSNVYSLRFGNLSNEHLPWLDLFCRKLLGLLEAWSVEQVVEIIARIPRLDREFRYPG